VRVRNGKDISKSLSTKDIENYFKELIRLSKEADRRFSKGQNIQSLSSLAAIPVIHKLLIEGCAEEPCKDKSVKSSRDHGVYL
tara:strand:+ start:4907 stop:5155 length:249 start_codon:yes stop_codon:yes gene_type:complete